MGTQALFALLGVLGKLTHLGEHTAIAPSALIERFPVLG